MFSDKFLEEPDLFWSLNTKRDEAGDNSSHLKTFPVKTRDSILIKVSKILMFTHFAYFSAIFGHISGTPDHFRPFNTV